MLQNIKVDIVYYKTNTDFEMEFNLCGCCRMRLLTDKAPDKKILVHDLARAVSRSRIIIITGPLFGEDGIIEIVARSIAKTLTEIDNGQYGISSDGKISIINGATPLVTPDGSFAGCIIESGPQSMVLLSDNKAVRKTVMKNLIHPYVEELYTMDLKAKTEKPAVKSVQETPAVSAEITDISPALAEEAEIGEPNETAAEEETAAESRTTEENPSDAEAEETTEATDEDGTQQSEEEQESADDADAQPLSSFSDKSENAQVSGGMRYTEEDGGDSEEGVSEEDNQKEQTAKKREDNPRTYESESDDDFIFRGGEGFSKKSGFASSGNLPILILSIALLIILAVLCYCIFYVPAKDGVSAAAYLQETFSILFG